MTTLARKLLKLAETKCAVFSEEEIFMLHTFAELFGKLEMLQEVQDRCNFPIKDKLAKITEEIRVLCSQNGMFDPDFMEEFLCNVPVLWVGKDELVKGTKRETGCGKMSA